MIAMVVFYYRLILGEETDVQANQGAWYEVYREVVPRLWPSPWAQSCAEWQTGDVV